jgi:hypothetical protein
MKRKWLGSGVIRNLRLSVMVAIIVRQASRFVRAEPLAGKLATPAKPGERYKCIGTMQQ